MYDGHTRTRTECAHVLVGVDARHQRCHIIVVCGQQFHSDRTGVMDLLLFVVGFVIVHWLAVDTRPVIHGHCGWSTKPTHTHTTMML
jgi:hypothetical protein